MYEYDFVPLETTRGTDYTFYDGSLSGTEGHWEIIAQRAAQGWRYVGYIPTVQGGSGRIRALELVFERKKEQ